MLLTLHFEVDPLADGGRDPVAGDAEIRPDVAPADRVEDE